MGSLASPGRQATIEAQRPTQRQPRNSIQRLIHSYLFPEVHNDNHREDGLEAALKASIIQSRQTQKSQKPIDAQSTHLEKLANFKYLKALLDDYSNLKSRANPGYVFWYDTFAAPLLRCWKDQCSNPSLQQCRDGYLDIAPDDSFSVRIEKLSVQLKSCPPRGLQLAQVPPSIVSHSYELILLWFSALVSEPDGKALAPLFSFTQNLRATFGGRLGLLRLAPSQSAMFLLAQEWHLPDRVLERLGAAAELRSRNSPIRPPSSKCSPGNLDPLQEHNDQFTLTWQSNAPMFKSDVDIFIWQQYKELPATEYVDVFMLPSLCPTSESPRILLSFRSIKSLRSFVSMRGSSSVYPSITEINHWSASSESVLSMIAMFKVMIEQSTDFLQGCADQSQKMKLAGRRDPTSGKIRFLIHLDDCRLSSLEGVIHALQILESIRRWIDQQQVSERLWDGGKPLDSRLTELRKDLEFLKTELQQAGEKIESLRKMVHEHLAITQGRRNFVLTILAAVYLPLSFVTSLFGMNMNTTTPEGRVGFSQFTNSTLAHLPANLANSTEALISTIGTSGSLTWDWKTFGITSGSLLTTIPLSLAIGGLFRWSVRSAAYYVTYWRILAAIAVSAIFFLNVIGAEFDFFALRELNACLGSSMSVWGLYRLYLALRRKRHRIFWMVFLCLVSAAWVLQFGFGPHPWMILPWAWLGWGWFRHWWKQRKLRKLSDE